MKKLFLFLILALLSLTIKSQTLYDNNVYIDTINPFICGVDSIPNIYYKIIPYNYKEYKEVYHNKGFVDVLTEISINNYIYKDMVGNLELFLANGKLYYIKFYCNGLNYNYYSFDEKLFKKYIIYWDEDEENSKWLFDSRRRLK